MRPARPSLQAGSTVGRLRGTARQCIRPFRRRAQPSPSAAFQREPHRRAADSSRQSSARCSGQSSARQSSARRTSGCSKPHALQRSTVMQGVKAVPGRRQRELQAQVQSGSPAPRSLCARLHVGRDAVPRGRPAAGAPGCHARTGNLAMARSTLVPNKKVHSATRASLGPGVIRLERYSRVGKPRCSTAVCARAGSQCYVGSRALQIQMRYRCSSRGSWLSSAWRSCTRRLQTGVPRKAPRKGVTD